MTSKCDNYVDKREGYCNIWALLDNKCVEKLDIFQYMQLQYVMFVKVIIMQFKFSQGSVATVCRWSGQIINCGVATYLSVLSAKCYKNRSMFVKITAK